MYADVLACFIIFQSVFFFLDAYVYSKTDRNIARKGEYTWFSVLIIVHMIYLALNSIWTMNEYEMFTIDRGVMTVLCMGSLFCISGCSFVFFMFTTERFDIDFMRRRGLRIVCLLPEMITALLILISPWSDLLFRINEENSLEQGRLYPLMLVSSSLYLIAVAVIAARNTFKAKTQRQRFSSTAFLASVLIILLFVAIDDLLMKASILPAAVFAVIVVIFIDMQNANIYSDALTGLNNRRRAMEYLADELRTVSADDPMYLYMGDLDNFKSINDLYSHLTGDEALLICSRALKSVTAEHGGFAARYGGDEFIFCLRPKKAGTDPELIIAELSERLTALSKEAQTPYNLSMSVGYMICSDPAAQLNDCIMLADQMLYERKDELHRSHSRKASAEKDKPAA